MMEAMMNPNLTNMRNAHLQKEAVKRRKSMLIYGTPNMKAKQY